MLVGIMLVGIVPVGIAPVGIGNPQYRCKCVTCVTVLRVLLLVLQVLLQCGWVISVNQIFIRLLPSS